MMDERNNVKYKYYILSDKWLARLPANEPDLKCKEFYKNGKWVFDESLNEWLNECMLDYGDSRWYEYYDASEKEAMEFIKVEEKENDEK